MNTFFKKSPGRRCTGIFPNGAIKNEIDYILTDKPYIFTGVSVINMFNTGSDHRMVRSRLTINTKLERARLTRRQKSQSEVVLSAKATEFQLLLTNGFEALQLQATENYKRQTLQLQSTDIFADVSVINRFNTGSDHRMVLSRVTINTKLQWARLTRRQK